MDHSYHYLFYIVLSPLLRLGSFKLPDSIELNNTSSQPSSLNEHWILYRFNNFPGAPGHVMYLIKARLLMHVFVWRVSLASLLASPKAISRVTQATFAFSFYCIAALNLSEPSFDDLTAEKHRRCS